MQGDYLCTLFHQPSGNIDFTKISPEGLADNYCIGSLFFSGHDVALLAMKALKAFVSNKKASGATVFLAEIFCCRDRYVLVDGFIASVAALPAYLCD